MTSSLSKAKQADLREVEAADGNLAGTKSVTEGDSAGGGRGLPGFPPTRLQSGGALRDFERLAVLTGVQVVATGSSAPEERLTNEDLGVWGYDADWILQRTGIRERRCAPPQQATSDLAYLAAQRCLDQAKLTAQDIDLIIVATMTPDSACPTTACLLQDRLGSRCPAFDMNAACAGFMYALVTGLQFVKVGFYRRVLVVGADIMSRVVDPEDKKTFPLFGDGAGAVLLGAGSEKQGLVSYLLGADGSGAELLRVAAGGSREPITPESLIDKRQYMRMEGRAVFKWAVRTVHEASARVLEHARVRREDVALMILHQANSRILDAVAQDLGIPSDRVMMNLERYGNTSAASIPLALDEAYRAGRIQRGDRILVAGFGAGLSWGAGLLVW